MCFSTMADTVKRGHQLCHTVAVILVLCSLVVSLTCFSLRGLSRKQDKVVIEAAVMEVRRGSILFNGKEFDSQSGSFSAAATENDGLLHTLTWINDGTGILEQMSQLEDAMANEAAWRRLNPSLYCGQNKMKLRAMGPRAADLQLDMGNARPLHLLQVPETCGYSMKQNALGLILVVPYDGCNVIQENGNYVLSMSWLETPVKFNCPMLTSSAVTPASTIPKAVQQPWKLAFLHGARHKRQTNQPLPNPYNVYWQWYNYYMYMMAQAPSAATTTAKPDTTTMTTKPSTENPPQINPPASPPNFYYPYCFPQYPYYALPPYPNVPVRTTTPPATTTAKTTGPLTTEMTTTAPSSSTMTTQKIPNPYYPLYIPYPYYPPAGQPMPGLPENSQVYYYPLIQHCYGAYPQMQTTQLPTVTTAKQGNPTPTTKPTTKPTTASATTAPTTASATTAPTTSCTKKPSCGKYPGPLSPYVPYYQLPFTPYVSYQAKAGKLPYDQKYMPPADYKSDLQARAHPPPHPGFNYWQPVPWLHHSTGKDNFQFD
ncbi:adhesive plaque matrix protein-like [Morone saxatilis]|uniref:adhesive plaque matrix protein-like n=1 Tax=Morone saxatilis TaxID=34816 RepID=UPI0015E1F1F6|nr:adhesive plaque matrix protein-like [Morone saxatilis]